MSFVLLGILNSQAAGAVGGAGDYDLLETTVLGSDTSSVTFSSLNSTYGSTYKHLQIRATMRTDRAAQADSFNTIFNADSGANYAYHFLFGDGLSVSSSGATSTNNISSLRVAASTNTANAFGAAVIDLLDPFDTSKNTTFRSLAGLSALDPDIALNSGLYINTNAITSVQLSPGAGSNFVTGSRFSLYGIKAA